MLTARWTGLEDITKKAEALGKELAEEKVLGPALVRMAQPLREDIKRAAPRSSVAPHVADTFVVKVGKAEREAGRLTVLVGPRAGYPGFVAPFLEYGTSKMRARPFIRPAYDGWVAAMFPGALVVELRRQFDRVIKKYAARKAAA